MTLSFLKPSALLAIALMPLAAHAEFAMAVMVDCRPARNELVVRFIKASDGADLQAGLNPMDLMSFYEADDGRVRAYRSERVQTCALKGAVYTLHNQPYTAPGWSPEGRCATRVGANVLVKKGGENVTQMLNDACTTSGEVPSRITLRSGKPVAYHWVPAADFNDD